MHIHIHEHPENVALADSVARLADRIGTLATAVQALADSQVPSAELSSLVGQVKAGAQLNDDLIDDAAPQPSR